MYVQDVLQTLNRFWAEKGCTLWQPYHTEVGAGTSNPATFLRVLGPEPWWVAYPEPSCRPADGRYAENPNRLQHYYQYQVILKPSPSNVQELYLQSMEALGLDLTKHDFRFVEDNWQSPSLGAWGLGWEAWIDGMEVLQFTYFQECGGVKLDVRACELTYGVERICMYLQGKESILDLEWAPSGITYGDIYRKQEIEFCTYNFEESDPEKLFQLFDMAEAEGIRLMEAGIIMPAYDHCLRLSHLFNLLDARGALSVSERGRFLLRCRTIAEGCAKLFYAQREEMGFPLMRLPRPIQDPPAPEDTFDPASLKEKDTLLLEIGVEELPYKDCIAVRKQAVPLAEKLLADAQFEHGDITLYLTPRRIALVIEDIPGKKPDVETVARGPKKAAAKDADGNWTVPAQRFAESKGGSVDDIYFEEAGKDEYCFVKVMEKGGHIGEFLDGFLEKFIRGLNFGKSMGWEDSTVVFSRPIRWLVALHGDTVVPASWKLRDETEIGPERRIYTGRETFGHRRLNPGAHTIASASSYLNVLRGVGVEPEDAPRMDALRSRAQAEADALKLKLEDDDDLFNEIRDITEWPEPILGTIPEEALSLPEEILITPMKAYQRYIPLRHDDGSLSKHFLCVANGEHTPEGRDVIRDGNERVLNARLRDAKYFWDTDITSPLSKFAEGLSGVVFHQKLGTVADKIERLKKLYPNVSDALPTIDDKALSQVLDLMKADLTTQMVGEFDSLEGVVGMLYAREQGIADDVALAIFEHRLPRRAGDGLPTGDLGLVAGLLDRFDSLAGYFGIGTKVKGASDPFGLRRNALAVLTLAHHAELDIDLQSLSLAAANNYGGLIGDAAKTSETLVGFFRDRLDVMLRDEGHAYDVVSAALAVHASRPLQARRAVSAVAGLSDDTVQQLTEQVKRMERIVKDPADAVDTKLLDADEKALHDLLTQSAAGVAKNVEAGNFDAACSEVAGWVPIIAAYFEKVMVNADDEAVKRNRHALLRDVSRAIGTIADFTLVEKRGAE